MLRVFVFANTFSVRGILRIPIVTLNSLGTCSLTGCPHWILSFIFWSVHVLPTIICVGIVKNSVQWNKTDEITWILASVGHEFTQVKCKRCVFKWTQCCYEKFFYEWYTGCDLGGVIGSGWFLLPLCRSGHQHHHVTQRGCYLFYSVFFCPVWMALQ